MKYYAGVFGSHAIPDFFIEDRIGAEAFKQLREMAEELLSTNRAMDIFWIKTKMGMVGFGK